MAVTITPQRFTLVLFDAAAIVATAEALLDRLGLADRDVHLVVDETSPLGRIHTDGTDPIVVHAESGALEDQRRPRHESSDAVALSLARVLLRHLDRDGAFADAPDDGDLTLQEVAAWNAYAMGRASRAGLPVLRQRWLYDFRNRHGFRDDVDEAFTRLWEADDLTWDDLVAISEGATASV